MVSRCLPSWFYVRAYSQVEALEFVRSFPKISLCLRVGASELVVVCWSSAIYQLMVLSWIAIFGLLPSSIIPPYGESALVAFVSSESALESVATPAWLGRAEFPWLSSSPTSSVCGGGTDPSFENEKPLLRNVTLIRPTYALCSLYYRTSTNEDWMGKGEGTLIKFIESYKINETIFGHII